MNWKAHINHLLFYVVVAVTSFLYWQQTKNNHIQTYTDSAIYLELADNIKNGNEYRIFLNGDLHYYSFHPPMYPALIAFLSEILNVDALTAARILAGFFLIITLWGFFLIFESLKINPLLQWIAYFLFIFSWVGELYHTVLSEQLFNIWLLFTIILSWQYIKNRSGFTVILLGILLGLSTLTRYATLGIIPPVLGWIYFNSHKKFKHTILFIFTYLLFIFPWLIYSLIYTGTAFERKLAFHPPGFEHLKQWVITTVNWLAPGWTYFMFFPLILLLFLVIRKTNLSGNFRVDSLKKTNDPFNLLLWIGVSYMVFILFSITFIDYDTPLDTRMLAPVYIILFISGVYFLQKYYQKKPLLINSFIALLLISHLADYGIKAKQRFLSVENDTGWPEKKIIQTLKSLHPEKIWSNATDIIKANTVYDSITYEIPVKFDRTSLRINPAYDQQMQQLKKEIRNGKGILVFFTRLNPRKFQPDEMEIRKYFKDLHMLNFPEGIIITSDKKNASQ